MIVLFTIPLFVAISIGLSSYKKRNQNLLNYYVGQQEIKKLQSAKVNGHYKIIDIENIGNLNESDAWLSQCD